MENTTPQPEIPVSNLNVDVNQSVPQSSDVQQPQTPVPPESKKVNHKLIYTFLGAIILILLVILGVMTFKTTNLVYNLSSTVPSSQPQETQEPLVSPIPTPTATTDPTAGWETYTNQAGFSFKYPSYFTLTSPDTFDPDRFDPSEYSNVGLYHSQYSQKPFFEVPHFKIVVLSKSLGTFDDQAQKYFDDNVNRDTDPMQIVEDFGKSKFNDNDSFEYLLSGFVVNTPSSGYVGYDGEYRFIWLENEENIISIIYTPVDLVFDQILSTFKFTDSADGVTMEEN